MTLESINPTDSHWTSNRYILWFGPYRRTEHLVWANNLNEALDISVDYLAENEPGLLVTEEVGKEFARLIEDEGMSNELANETSTMDTTCAGSYGDYLNSWEWGIVSEDPTRELILTLQGRYHA